MDLNAGVGSWYAGVGSRDTPQEILELILLAGVTLAQDGWGLRTGGAPGADSAFEGAALLVGGEIEMYLPWPGFEDRSMSAYTGGRDHPSKEAFALAAEHHPAWDRLSVGARSLHARNCHQVLGFNLNDPAKFVLCWTPDGKGGGGTGQAIRVAGAFQVPVYDLANRTVRERIEAYAMEETPTL